MNILVLLVLLSVLFTSLFVLIPMFAPENQQEEIKHWVGLSFSGLLLLIALFETKFSDYSLITPVLFYLFVLGFILSGIYWWIPTFIPSSQQTDTVNYMFIGTTLAIILVNMMSPAMKPTYFRSTDPYSALR